MNESELMVLATAILFSTGAAQDIIENPAKPLSANAGRVVTLKEEMRIEDTGEGFFFKTPYTIRVSSRGHIFVRDGQEQALQFDAEGRFIRISLRSTSLMGKYGFKHRPSRRAGEFYSICSTPRGDTSIASISSPCRKTPPASRPTWS